MNKFKVLLLTLSLTFNAFGSEQEEEKTQEVIERGSHIPANRSYEDAVRPMVQDALSEKVQYLISNNLLTKRNASIAFILLAICKYKMLWRILKAVNSALPITGWQKAFIVFAGGVWRVCFCAPQAQIDSSAQRPQIKPGEALNINVSQEFGNRSGAPVSASAVQEPIYKHDAIIVRQVFTDAGLSGLWAMRNGFLVFEELKDDKNNRNLLLSQDYLDLGPAIEQARNGEEVYKNLDASLLAQSMQNWRRLPEDNYSIAADLNNQYSQASLLEVIQGFRAQLEKLHLFLLGVPLNKSTQWFSVVVQKKKNRLAYYAMNSIAGFEFRPLVQKLKELIETGNLDNLKAIVIASEIQDAIKRAEAALSSGEAELSMLNLYKFADLIIRNNLQNTPAITEKYCERARKLILDQRARAYGVANNGEALRLLNKLQTCFPGAFDGSASAASAPRSYRTNFARQRAASAAAAFANQMYDFDQVD